MINIKYCRRCKKPFDMGEGELCPECRGENINIDERGERENEKNL